MRKLILIKHASPLVDPTKSSDQWRLSEKGIESCGPLAEALRAHEPAIIVSSEEPKAAETAQLVSAKLGVPTDATRDLHEHDRSNVPHMRSGEFISHMELFFRRPTERVLGRESADEATKRIESAIAAVLNHHPAGNVAIVTHGTVLALFLARHSNRNGFELWRQMGLPSFAIVTAPEISVTDVIARI